MNPSISQPTYKRQRFLLSFICQLQDSVSATDIQKLVFLHIMETNSGFYEFIPYKYGAYSFQLAEDIEILRRDGYLLHNTFRIEATDKSYGSEIYSIDKERGNKLIRKAYRQYPYYAINSEITDRLFNEREAAVFKQEKDKYTQTEQILFTVGYEGKTIENYINILIQNNIRILVDVRKNPISRKFGFSKNKLEHIVETVGIRYVHIPALGIESEDRTMLKTKEDYSKLFNMYKKTLENQTEHLEYLYSLFSANYRIALTCFEKEAEMCHRHVIRDYLVQKHAIRSIDL